MFRNYNGFTLLETMISLSIWFVLMYSLFPQFIHLEKQRRNLELRVTASQILQEENYHYIYDNELKSTEMKTVNNEDFIITWKVMDDNMVKICISWENATKQNDRKCGYGKK